MIIAVDDEHLTLEIVKSTLEGDGFSVLAFTSAPEALERAAADEPHMIISDITMPEMDGFGFRAAYTRRFPHRTTPFVFLSSLGDPETVVRGIRTGADDYLLKPVHPEILKAKVRSLLQRKTRWAAPAFHGDLGRFPLVKIMQFCETKALNGVVEVPFGNSCARLRFRGGNIDMEDGESADAFDRVYDLAEGTFTIYPDPVDYREIEAAAISAEGAVGAADEEKPMGRLSGVKVNQRLFQIQTEFVTLPECAVLTVVILDGKVMMKRATPAAGKPMSTLEALIDEQHGRVEAEVREKISSKMKPKEESEEAPRERFGRLFEAGFEKYRAGLYAEALALWEEARELDPADKTLAINLGIVRKKIGE